MDLFNLILSLTPFFIFSILLIFFRKASLFLISFITLIVTAFIAIVFWQSSFSLFLLSFTKGSQVALDILYIIFGALLFLSLLKKINITENLAYHLNNFSSDFRIQVIILAWFLENFLEGIAGFGTPAMIVAPILVSLGISPLKSIVISLLGNSIAVSFGAVGTPIRIGFAGINLDFVSIGINSAFYGLVGLIVPVFMLFVLVSHLQNKKDLFLQGVPFALWSGFAFVIPVYFISFLGIEFPSILGSIIGLILVLLTIKLRLFVPKEVHKNPKALITPSILLNLKHIIFPYSLFILLLILAKIFLTQFNLFNPGFVFIITSLIIAVIYKINFNNLFLFSKTALTKTLEPFLVIFCMSSMVQIMNNSGITTAISQIFKSPALIFISPFVGAYGAFITGSATVSNIMFGSAIFESSIFMSLNPINILALLATGAGIGNMVAIADVLSAKTVTDSRESISSIIFALLPYCLFYLTLVGLFGLITSTT
ncbi:L-lactate permease [Patescibacteria group bacterium]|nr:L-lactate permease [Patescibacteria group bacterium]